MPFPVGLLLKVDGQVKDRAEFFDIAGIFLFQGHVATGLQAFAAHLGHDVFHTLAGFEIMDPVFKGLNEHLQAKSGPVGQEMHIDGRIRLDEVNVCILVHGGVGGNGGVDGHEG